MIADAHRAPAGRRVAVLVSGAGTLLQALLDAAAGSDAGFGVCAVVSDRPQAAGLERARALAVPTAVVSPDDFDDRSGWDTAIARAVGAFHPDLVVLAGFMRLLGEAFLDRFGGRTLNCHPALLPAFPGPHAVQDALAYGVKITGCSVILVDAGLDTGPVVAQRAVDVRDGDDEASLHERIKQAERQLIVEVVGRMASGEWSVTGRQVVFA